MARSSFFIPNELKICIELQEKMQQPVSQEEQ